MSKDSLFSEEDFKELIVRAEISEIRVSIEEEIKELTRRVYNRFAFSQDQKKLENDLIRRKYVWLNCYPYLKEIYTKPLSKYSDLINRISSKPLLTDEKIREVHQVYKEGAEQLQGLLDVLRSNMDIKESQPIEDDTPEVILLTNNDSNRLALFEQLGIVSFLQEKYHDALNNRPGRTIALLAMLMGIESKDLKTFTANAKNLLNRTDKSPNNSTSKKRNSGELTKIGIDLPKK